MQVQGTFTFNPPVHMRSRYCFFFYYNLFIYLFIFGCAGSLLLCGLFSSCGEWGLLSGCGAWASHCGGFSCCGAPAPGAWASVVAAHGLSSCGSPALEHRLNSCAWPSCSEASRIFPDQGSNPCLLCWQANFLPVSP